MSYLRLFFSLIYHGIRARVYLWALEYVVDYQHSKPPTVILGGGNEWKVSSQWENTGEQPTGTLTVGSTLDPDYGAFKFWDNESDAEFDKVKPDSRITFPSLYDEGKRIETLLADAAEEGWPV